MKIKLAFRRESADSDDWPWVESAVDECTEEDSWGGLPDFYVEVLQKDPGNTREVVIRVPDHVIAKLFTAVEADAEVVG